MRAEFCCINNMAWVTRGSDEDFAIKLIMTPDLHDLCNKFHAIFASIIETSDEGTDDICPCFRSEQSLSRREDERCIRPNPFRTEVLEGFQSLRRHRDFYIHMLVP